MDEIRIGIFGVGHRGIHWLRILDRMDGYRITAIGDMFPQLHERALGELSDSNGVATHSSYEEMLADRQRGRYRAVRSLRGAGCDGGDGAGGGQARELRGAGLP